MLTFLGLFNLLDFLLINLMLFLSLSADITLFICLHLAKLSHFLLLSHHFRELFFLLLLSFAGSVYAHLFNSLNPLIEVMSLALPVLILPVLGALLANLELDLERVQLLYDRLVCVLLVFLVTRNVSSLFFKEFALAMRSLASRILYSFLTAFLKFDQVLLV